MHLSEDPSLPWVFFGSSPARFVHIPHRLPHTVSFQSFSTFTWLVFGSWVDCLHLRKNYSFRETLMGSIFVLISSENELAISPN